MVGGPWSHGLGFLAGLPWLTSCPRRSPLVPDTPTAECVGGVWNSSASPFFGGAPAHSAPRDSFVPRFQNPGPRGSPEASSCPNAPTGASFELGSAGGPGPRDRIDDHLPRLGGIAHMRDARPLAGLEILVVG